MEVTTKTPFLALKVPPLLQVLCAVGLMFVCARYFPLYRFSFPAQNILISLLAMLSVSINLFSVFTFHHIRTTVSPLQPSHTTQIVTSGPFQYSRNPMYLGFFLVLCAAGIYFGAIINIVVIIIFLYYITVFQIIPEEKILTRAFSKQYLSYCKKVPRWI